MRYVPPGGGPVQVEPSSDLDIVQRRRIARAARRARQRRIARMVQSEPEEEDTPAPLAEVVPYGELLRLRDKINERRSQ